MSAGPQLPQRGRWIAPGEHGGTLIDPPLEHIGALLDHNIRSRQNYAAEIAGLRCDALIREARGELLAAARRYTSAYREVPVLDPAAPLVLAGHQPELFHPGVWFKNFVLGWVARRHRAVALNLVIDNDARRAASIRVPSGTVAEPSLGSVALDAASEQIPYEERPILDRSLLESFPRRVGQEIEAFVSRPLVHKLWPLVLEQSRHTDRLGLCLAQGRHRLEGQWGLETLELPASEVCQLPTFRRFAVHLLVEMARFRGIYNGAVVDYRRAHKVRSRTHPVPELETDADWVEAPLWMWRRDDPRRRRVFVRQAASELLLSDRRHTEFRLPLNDRSYAAAADRLGQLEEQGVKLRTRALLTTMWARLVLGDLFLHGIGGAKYDQVTDQVIRQFFGVQPLEYMTVTATLRLPIDRPPTDRQQLLRVEHVLRELDYHPERFIERSGLSADLSANQVEALIAQKQRWIATAATSENARDRARAIRGMNEALQPALSQVRQRLTLQREELVKLLHAEAILAARHYSFCIHPEESLRKIMLEFLADSA